MLYFKETFTELQELCKNCKKIICGAQECAIVICCAHSRFSPQVLRYIWCGKAKFRECSSFVRVNAVLMCRPFLPSKTVKTSWIRRNPVGMLETVPSPKNLLSMWGNTRAIQHPFWCLQAAKCRWEVHSHLKREQSRLWYISKTTKRNPVSCYTALYALTRFLFAFFFKSTTDIMHLALQ